MIDLKIIAHEPIHLADGHTVGPSASTLDYIPGSALRGAVAAGYLNRFDVDDRFHRFFLADGVSYGPLLPLGRREKAEREAFFIPVTAHTCKSQPGFRPTGHGVRDSLFVLLQEEVNRSQTLCAEEACQVSLIPHSGFYSDTPGGYRAVQPSKRLETRTALDSRRETTAREQLFSLEVLEETQLFRGFIRLPSRQEEELLVELLLEPGQMLRIGGARTRGHGLVEITRARVSEEPVSELLPPGRSLADRVREMDRKARESGLTVQQQTIFVLTLLSDLIVRDRFLRFTTQLSPEALAQHIHPHLARSQLLAAFGRQRTLDGWNAAHRLPRSTELVIAAGSVFAYGIDTSPEQLAKWLQPLEGESTGERQAEGFGHIVVAHPFHLQEAQV